jgi:hypothetical protein
VKRIGRYEVAGLLATGGMAEILLGRLAGPSGFERTVVLKRILPHLARKASFVAMFLDEARIAARIQHPNVVQVHDFIADFDEPVIVMEHLQGETLSSLQRRLTSLDRGLDPTVCAHIAAEAAAAASRPAQTRSPVARSRRWQSAAIAAEAGIVKIQAQTIRPATPHRTAESFWVAPTPTMAPVIVCVVETGIPRPVAAKRVMAPAVSAQKPPTGLSFVIFMPMVFTILQPPAVVPSAMAAWHAITTQSGTWNSPPSAPVA